MLVCQLIRKPAASAGWHHCLELNKALTRLVSADQIARFVAENVRAFNAINVATACHRLAKTHQLCGKMHSRGQSSGPREDARQSISALIARASETVGDFKPQEVANLMWALATLGVDPGAELATAMSRRAVASAGEFKQQDVANLMWALAVLSCEDQACCYMWVHALSLLVLVLCRNLGCYLVTDRAVEAAVLRQLHQTLLCVELEGLWPELNLAGLLGPDTMRLCRQAFEGAGVRASKLQVRPD